MPAPELTFELVDAALAAEHADELQQLHAEACAGPLDDQEAARTAKRFRVQRRQPGFVLAEARSGGYLVGFASGQPLRPSTSWWRDLTTALPEEVTAERPGRTFALNEVVVRASWRRQGIGSDLHDLVIRGRPEERATVAIAPAAAPAQGAFQAWGWRRIARRRDTQSGPVGPPGDASPAVLDVLVRTLPAGLS